MIMIVFAIYNIKAYNSINLEDQLIHVAESGSITNREENNKETLIKFEV